MSEAEKAMVGTEYIEKLNADLKALDDLGKGKSPHTGDTGNMTLWIAIILVSGGALGVFGRKLRKRKNKIA